MGKSPDADTSPLMQGSYCRSYSSAIALVEAIQRLNSVARIVVFISDLLYVSVIRVSVGLVPALYKQGKGEVVPDLRFSTPLLCDLFTTQ